MAELISVQEAQGAITSASPSGELIDAALVQTYIDATVAVIEDLSQPVTSLDRQVTVDGGREAVMLPWPFTDVVSAVESGVTLASDDYVADGGAGILYRGSSSSPSRWRTGRRNVVVTVSTGVDMIPGNQKLAAMMLFVHLWRTRQGPRPRLANPGGDVVFAPAGFAVPNAVAELLVATPRLPGFA